MLKKYGYPTAKWNRAKAETKQHLIKVAKKKALITYGDLADKIRAIPFHYRDEAFYELLGEISTEEHKARRGMLTAIVVSKTEGIPGWGFFELAVELKLCKSYKNGKDEMELWTSQLYKVWP